METLKKLLQKIEFSSDNIVAAAADNSALFLKAVEYRIQAYRAKSAAKMALETMQAEKELKIRGQAREIGERITERNVEALLLIDKEVRNQMEAFNQADEEEEYSRLVVEAFRMRRDCLRIIGDLVRDEMSLQRAAEIGTQNLREVRKRAGTRFPSGA